MKVTFYVVIAVEEVQRLLANSFHHFACALVNAQLKKNLILTTDYFEIAPTFYKMHDYFTGFFSDMIHL